MLTIIPSRIQAEWRVSSIWTSPSDGPSVFLYRKLRTIYIFIDCRRGGLVKWEKTFESILHQRVRRSWRLIKPQLCTLLYQSGSQKHDGDNALEYVLHSWSIEIGTKTKKNSSALFLALLIFIFPVSIIHVLVWRGTPLDDARLVKPEILAHSHHSSNFN